MHTARLHHPCTRLCTGRLHGRLRPCTWRVHGPVHEMCTRPCTGRAHGRVRAIYMAKSGRLIGHVTCRVYGRVRAVSARVHGSVRAVCTAVFGRVQWPCTLPFSAVYIARTPPCNGPCTRPLHGRVQGPSGPCIRQVGLPRRVHIPKRHATAVCGPLRIRSVYAAVYRARVDEHVHGCVWDMYTTVYMACYGRVHGPLP